jgi:hypothetical protein
VNEQGGLTYKYREVPLRNYKNEQGKIRNLSDTYGSEFAATEGINHLRKEWQYRNSGMPANNRNIDISGVKSKNLTL